MTSSYTSPRAAQCHQKPVFHSNWNPKLGYELERHGRHLFQSMLSWLYSGSFFRSWVTCFQKKNKTNADCYSRQQAVHHTSEPQAVFCIFQKQHKDVKWTDMSNKTYRVSERRGKRVNAQRPLGESYFMANKRMSVRSETPWSKAVSTLGDVSWLSLSGAVVRSLCCSKWNLPGYNGIRKHNNCKFHLLGQPV